MFGCYLFCYLLVRGEKVQETFFSSSKSGMNPASIPMSKRESGVKLKSVTRCSYPVLVLLVTELAQTVRVWMLTVT